MSSLVVPCTQHREGAGPHPSQGFVCATGTQLSALRVLISRGGGLPAISPALKLLHSFSLDPSIPSPPCIAPKCVYPHRDREKEPAVCHRGDNYIPAPIMPSEADLSPFLSSHHPPASLTLTEQQHQPCDLSPEDMTYRAWRVDKGKAERAYKSPE